MVKKPYVPSRRDIIWIDFNPTRGHEQSSVRPALVLSEKAYNQKTNLAVVCPITSKAKGFGFEVPISELELTGVILSDHVRSLDWSKRNTRFIQKASVEVCNEVEEKLSTLLFN
jgi:mRNA interferase MazF